MDWRVWGEVSEKFGGERGGALLALLALEVCATKMDVLDLQQHRRREARLKEERPLDAVIAQALAERPAGEPGADSAQSDFDAFVRGVPLLSSHVKQGHLHDHLRKAVVEVHLKTGEPVVHQNDAADAVFYIRDGICSTLPLAHTPYCRCSGLPSRRF